MKYNIVLILVIISIFSGCVDSTYTSSDTERNQKVNLENLEIVVLDYEIYKGVDFPNVFEKNILKIDFSLTNIGTNKIEPFPDGFAIILKDGKQIKHISPNDIGNAVEIITDLPYKPGDDILPGALDTISVYFLVPKNFDIKSTKIAVISGDIFKPFG